MNQKLELLGHGGVFDDARQGLTTAGAEVATLRRGGVDVDRLQRALERIDRAVTRGIEIAEAR